MKRPAFQFYPGDWRKDVPLRSCSLAARGLWIDLMTVMHDCEPYGHLVLNGNAMTAEQIVNQIGGSAAQIRKLLDELVGNGVARKTTEGVIYSKRMVEDETLRNLRAEGGKAGAEHGVKGASHGSKGGRPKSTKGGCKTPLTTALDAESKPPPSSSSSSSTSSLRSEGEKRASAPPRPEDVAEQVWADWLTLRKQKRAPVTATVLEGARSEADKAGISLDAFLRVWCRRGSQGLEASWLKADEKTGAQQLSFRERDQAAARAAGHVWMGSLAPKDQNVIDMEAANVRQLATR